MKGAPGAKTVSSGIVTSLTKRARLVQASTTVGEAVLVRLRVAVLVRVGVAVLVRVGVRLSGVGVNVAVTG